jgi:hypothetical protein
MAAKCQLSMEEAGLHECHCQMLTIGSKYFLNLWDPCPHGLGTRYRRFGLNGCHCQMLYNGSIYFLYLWDPCPHGLGTRYRRFGLNGCHCQMLTILSCQPPPPSGKG